MAYTGLYVTANTKEGFSDIFVHFGVTTNANIVSGIPPWFTVYYNGKEVSPKILPIVSVTGVPELQLVSLLTSYAKGFEPEQASSHTNKME